MTLASLYFCFTFLGDGTGLNSAVVEDVVVVTIGGGDNVTICGGGGRGGGVFLTFAV